MGLRRLIHVGIVCTATVLAACGRGDAGASGTTDSPVPPVAATAENLSLGAATSQRAVVVIEGGGSPHPYTTPWAACDDGRPPFVQAMVGAGLAVFTAPGYTNTRPSTDGDAGCPAQPPAEVQWNTSGYPTQTGQSVLGFLGFLNATYGYETFDLVGYSYGGIVSRATVAALKSAAAEPSPGDPAVAPGFSYAQWATGAAVTIPLIVTLNTPHLGGPAYDVAADPATYFEPVSQAWGQQFADSAATLVPFEREGGAGAIQVLRTSAHANADPESWDARQVGMLDGVALTLLAGDYCGQTCGEAPVAATDDTPATDAELLRTDAVVPVYSQLMLPCPQVCPTPPGSVHIPDGLLPAEVVRQTFPTVHSTFSADSLDLPREMSVSWNPEAITYLVDSVTQKWEVAGAPLLSVDPRG